MLPTLASLAGIAKLNAAEKGQYANTARISRSIAFMRMGNETGLRSKSYMGTNSRRMFGLGLLRGREIRQMAEKLEEYERLLRDLSFRACDVDQSLIHQVLQKASSPST